MVRNAKILLLCKKNVFKCITLKEYDHALLCDRKDFSCMIFLHFGGKWCKVRKHRYHANN